MLLKMTVLSHILTLICVFAIAGGQVLFKLVGNALNETGSIWHPRVFLSFLAAMVLYGGATLLWIRLLQSTALSRLYPYLALSFVIVPLLSWLLYSEPLTFKYWVGIALILLGIYIVANSWAD